MTPSPLRAAFVGCPSDLDAHAPADDARTNYTRIPFGADDDVDDLRRQLGACEPDVVVVLDAGIVTPGAFAGLPAATLGFVRPDPSNPGRLLDVAATEFDRLVATDLRTLDATDGMLPVWRSVPLPVADRWFRPVAPLRGAPRAVFIGASSPHREMLLSEAKRDRGLVHVPSAASANELADVLNGYDVAVNLHHEQGPEDGYRVRLHLAAGHLTLSEPLPERSGLEPGIDYLEIHTSWQVARVLGQLSDFPGAWHSVRARGRRKAETFRASRVYTRLLHDLRADVAARGGARRV